MALTRGLNVCGYVWMVVTVALRVWCTMEVHIENAVCRGKRVTHIGVYAPYDTNDVVDYGRCGKCWPVWISYNISTDSTYEYGLGVELLSLCSGLLPSCVYIYYIICGLWMPKTMSANGTNDNAMFGHWLACFPRGIDSNSNSTIYTLKYGDRKRDSSYIYVLLLYANMMRLAVFYIVSRCLNASYDFIL